MTELATKTTMRDVFRAWNNVERSGAQACRTIYEWVQSGAPLYNSTDPAENWDTYLASCLQVTKRRAHQLYEAGRTHAELGTRVPPQLLAKMSERHLRHLTVAVNDPEVLDEVAVEIDERAAATSRPMIPNREVKQVVNEAMKRAHPEPDDTPGWVSQALDDTVESLPARLYQPTIGTPLQRARDGLLAVVSELDKVAKNPPGFLLDRNVKAMADTLRQNQRVIAGWCTEEKG